MEISLDIRIEELKERVTVGHHRILLREPFTRQESLPTTDPSAEGENPLGRIVRQGSFSF